MLWQVNGGQLPPHVVPYCAVAAVLAALLPVAAFFLGRASAKLQERPALAQVQVRRPSECAASYLGVVLSCIALLGGG